MKTQLLGLILVIGFLAGCNSLSTSPDLPTRSASAASAFTLTSPAINDDGTLPVEYTCDGDGSTPALTWSGAPAGTQSYAVIMHHVAGPADVHWYWVLYDIPASVTSLPKDVSGVGVLGNNYNTGRAEYSPPCSKGPGPKEYTYTVYALSAQPQLAVPAVEVDRDTLLNSIKDITLASAELAVTYSRDVTATTQSTPQTNDVSPAPAQADDRTPPTEAIAVCVNKAAQDTCEFTWEKGTETGVCEMVQNQLACSPKRGPASGDQQPGKGGSQSGGGQPDQSGKQQGGAQPVAANGSAYNIEQAISDKAQGMTISYDALAFLTGDLGSDSFFPPGKVADFWGFQYLRDNDPSEMGHAGEFLTSAAMNMLNILTADQRAQLVALAKSQVSQINEYGYKRFVLMEAFRRLVNGDLPTGTTGLSEDAVKAYSAELYQLDGEISYARAQLMGQLLNGMSAEQKVVLDALKGKGMKDWPSVAEPSDIKGLDRDEKVAVMTYAADMLSWYVGSVEADVYFCPERHGTYFGSFYLKDIFAMSDPTYAIPTNMTGDMGEALLQKLSIDQAKQITGLVDIQKSSLQGIVETRRAVATELRKFLAGGTADKAAVLKLMEQYGAYDGAIIYNLATHFNAVSQSLTADQQAQLTAMRAELLGDLTHPSGAYLYSQAVPMPEIPNTDFLFK